MPKLWNDTIEAHRRDVRDAVVAAAANLVASEGLLAVTMSRVAEETGIGRATLYKYFPDVESILLAWHDRQVAEHMQLLAQTRGRANDASERLEDVLATYANLRHDAGVHRDTEIAALLHGSDRATRAERELHDMVRDLIAHAAARGSVRADVPADELASYCLSALAAAGQIRSKAGVRRLLSVTLDGLRA